MYAMLIRYTPDIITIEMIPKGSHTSRFLFMAGLVLARVADPVTAQQVVGIITGMGG